MRVVVAEQRERTRHLRERRERAGQVGRLRRVAEEAVEDLFGVSQAGLQLAGERRHRQPFLGVAREAVEPFGAVGRVGVPERGRLDAPHDRRGALVERGVEPAGAFERAFEKQQRGRDVEPDARRRLAWIEAEVGRDAVDDLRDVDEAAPLQRHHRVEQQAGGADQRIDLRLVAADDRGPRVFRLGQRVAGALRRPDVDQSVALPLEIGRDQLVEAKARSNRGDAVVDRSCRGDREQRVGEQPIVDRRRSFDELADLQVDAPREPLQVGLLHAGRVERVGRDRLEQRARHPPERALRRMRRGRGDRPLDRRDRAGERVDGVVVAIVAHVAQQRVLVGAALLGEALGGECFASLVARRRHPPDRSATGRPHAGVRRRAGPSARDSSDTGTAAARAGRPAGPPGTRRPSGTRRRSRRARSHRIAPAPPRTWRAAPRSRR